MISRGRKLIRRVLHVTFPLVGLVESVESLWSQRRHRHLAGQYDLLVYGQVRLKLVLLAFLRRPLERKGCLRT